MSQRRKKQSESPRSLRSGGAACDIDGHKLVHPQHRASSSVAARPRPPHAPPHRERPNNHGVRYGLILSRLCAQFPSRVCRCRWAKPPTRRQRGTSRSAAKIRFWQTTGATPVFAAQWCMQHQAPPQRRRTDRGVVMRTRAGSPIACLGGLTAQPNAASCKKTISTQSRLGNFWSYLVWPTNHVPTDCARCVRKEVRERDHATRRALVSLRCACACGGKAPSRPRLRTRRRRGARGALARDEAGLHDREHVAAHALPR